MTCSKIVHRAGVIEIGLFLFGISEKPFFEALRGQSEAEVATKSPFVVPISMISRYVFVFFIFFARFRDIFRSFFLEMPISLSLGVSILFLHRPERMTKTKSFSQKLAENFRRKLFFC